MNRRLLTLFVALMTMTVSVFAGDVLINAQNFPDEKFREFLLSQNYGSNGQLSEREIEDIVEINVQNKGIKSLKGIEFFKYLEVLKCDINDLGSLDVSQNTALKELSCSICNLQGLDLSKNTALTSLSCLNNKDLGELDVSNNKELTFLWCENDGLKSLSVVFNTKLISLKCSWNQLSSLSLLTNQDLERLECRRNALTELNLSNNEKLTYLDCAGNNINAAKMQDIVEALPTYTSGDHTFKVYDDEAETNNVITTKQTSITDSKRWSAQRTSGVGWVGVYGTAIHKTYFPDKNFREFLLAQNYGKDCLLSNEEVKAITSLDVSGLGIKNLTGIEYFTNVEALNCKNNQLQTLDLSKNTKLTLLTCYNNQIRGPHMSALVTSLPSSSDIKTIYVISGDETEQNDITTTQVAAAKEKNWIPYNYNNGSPVAYEGIDPNVAINEKNFPDENFRTYLLSQTYGADGKLTEAELKTIDMLSIDNKGIKDLKGIEYFTALTSLSCYNNSLTSIDVSMNTELVTLNCKDNQLTSLDLSRNTKLRCLYCERNKLTSLDVSACPELFELYCEGNQIKGSGMDILVNSLNGEHGQIFRVRKMSYTEDNVMTPSQVKIATDKGWRVLIDNGVDWLNYAGEELSVSIDETNFPDANFRNFLLEQEYGIDKKLTEEELRSIIYLNVSAKNISNLKGIEYLCWVRGLYCMGNQLTSLDLKNCIDLTGVYVSNNQIKGEQMDALIASLPTGTDGSLYVIDEDSGPELNVCTSQQVAAAEEKGWTVLFLADDQWRLNYPGNDKGIAIGKRNFPDDNFREFVADKTIDKNEDRFLTTEERVDVTVIGVNGMGIKNLKGIEFFMALKELYCKNNSELESLDLSFNIALQWLSCNYCGLTTLNLSKNTELVNLDCGGNKLTELDITNNTKLKALRCYKNQLTSLDVSKNKDLYYVGCHQNKIKALQMGQLVNDLPDVNHLESNPQFQYYVEFNVISDTDEGNIITRPQVAAARAKGWNVNAYSGTNNDFLGFVEINTTNFPDANFRNYVAKKQIDQNEDGYLSEAELKVVTNMPIMSKSIENLKGVEFFTELTGLHCHNNKLQSLDVSKNTKLETLNCFGNKLSSLDLSANTALKYLACYNNGMTSLKLSTSATNLAQVYCYGNKLEGEAMDQLVNGLPTVSESSACLLQVNADDITPDNIITAAQVKVATDKNWIVKKFHNSEEGSSVFYAGLGDANGDNNIDEDDLSLIEDIIMGQLPEGMLKLAGDLNNDGKVDAADIVIMVNILNGK